MTLTEQFTHGHFVFKLPMWLFHAEYKAFSDYVTRPDVHIRLIEKEKITLVFNAFRFFLVKKPEGGLHFIAHRPWARFVFLISTHGVNPERAVYNFVHIEYRFKIFKKPFIIIFKK